MSGRCEFGIVSIPAAAHSRGPQRGRRCRAGASLSAYLHPACRDFNPAADACRTDYGRFVSAVTL